MRDQGVVFIQWWCSFGRGTRTWRAFRLRKISDLTTSLQPHLSRLNFIFLRASPKAMP